jgi:hemolysin activation/secretion protein
LQTISGPWQVNLSATGQYSWQPLLASEQFGFGGPAFGRAYDPSEITGDNGAAGSAELRYSSVRFEELRFGLTPFVYYDIGKVWNISTGGEPASAASAGGGLVLRSDTGLQLTTTGAEPLTRPQANPETGNGKSPRWLANLSWQF